MLLHPRHGWHLGGTGHGAPAAGEVNLKTRCRGSQGRCRAALAERFDVPRVMATAIASVPIAIVLAALGGRVRAKMPPKTT